MKYFKEIQQIVRVKAQTKRRMAKENSTSILHRNRNRLTAIKNHLSIHRTQALALTKATHLIIKQMLEQSHLC